MAAHVAAPGRVVRRDAALAEGDARPDERRGVLDEAVDDRTHGGGAAAGAAAILVVGDSSLASWPWAPIILVFFDKTPRYMPLDDSESADVMPQTLGSPWLALA